MGWGIDRMRMVYYLLNHLPPGPRSESVDEVD